MEDEADHNGLVPALTLKLKNGALVTGIYNIPATPPSKLTATLDKIMSVAGERNFVVGDHNARNRHWDSENNPTGNALMAWQMRKRLRISSSPTPSFPAENRGITMKASNIDIMIHNTRAYIPIEAVQEREQVFPVTEAVRCFLSLVADPVG